MTTKYQPGDKFEVRDPDGKVFGKKNLRVTTSAAFGRLLKGYRHEYECDEETEEAA